MLLYFVVMPRVYGFSTLGSFWRLATLSFPFILATSFLGQALGLVFRHRETAVLVVLASSLPQFFLVGVSWPAEAIPAFLRSAREAAAQRQRHRRLRADRSDGGEPCWRCGHAGRRLWVLTLFISPWRSPWPMSGEPGSNPMRNPFRMKPSSMKPHRKKLVLVGLPLAWPPACSASGMPAARRAVAPETLIGMVRTTEIHIAPEISGRLARVLVTPASR